MGRCGDEKREAENKTSFMDCGTLLRVTVSPIAASPGRVLIRFDLCLDVRVVLGFGEAAAQRLIEE